MSDNEPSVRLEFEILTSELILRGVAVVSLDKKL